MKVVNRSRESLTVTIKPSNRARLVAAAELLGIPLSRAADMVLEGRLRVDGDRVVVVGVVVG